MGLRKVRMRTQSAGPEGVAAPGQIVIVDDLRAKALVDGGFGEYVDGVEETEGKRPAIETATAEAPENAMMPEVKRRKAGK